MQDLIKRIKNVDFEITFDCNLRCLHCYNKTHKVNGELTTDEILGVIDQIAELHFPEIHINGGEPLKHPDIISIITNCNTRRLETLLETNGVFLTEDKIKEIRKLKYLKVRASIDGPERVHNSIRRSVNIDNPYLISINNLVRAQELGIMVQVTCSVNNINYLHLTEMVDDLFHRGINDIRLRLSMPASSGYVHWQVLKLNAAKFEEIRKQVEYIHNTYKIHFDRDSIFRLFPKLEQKMFITPHGNVKPYPFIEAYAGNVKTQSLKEILDNYRGVCFPSEIEQLMNEYVTELGMGGNYE